MSEIQSSHPALSGVVLAGGFSTRFGDEDKAIADLAGKPLIGYVVDALLEITDTIVVNCRADQREEIEAALEGELPERAALEFAVDPVPDRGPVAGIRTGLEAVDHEYAAVVACDMPFCSPVLLELLAERAGGRDGAIVRLADGWFQPTQAVYRTDAMAGACADVLDSGGGRILRAIEAIDCVVLEEGDQALSTLAPETLSRTFESVDTRTELEQAARRLEQGKRFDPE